MGWNLWYLKKYVEKINVMLRWIYFFTCKKLMLCFKYKYVLEICIEIVQME